MQLRRVFVGGASLPVDSKYVPVMYTFATVNSTILLVVTAVTTDLPVTQAIVTCPAASHLLPITLQDTTT